MKDKTNKSKECCENYPICECHTKAPQEKDTSWRERMASAFNGAMHGCGVGYGENQEWLFRAVEQEIQKAKEQTISSVIEEIEKIHKDEITEVFKSNNRDTTKEYIKKGLEIYKQEVVEKLKTLLKQKIN